MSRQMRVMVIYEHCSPHQVCAIDSSCRYFQERGSELIPLEYYGGSVGYGWKFADKARPDNWLCMFPDREKAKPWEVFKEIRKTIRQTKPQMVLVNGWYHIVNWWLASTQRILGIKVALSSDSNFWDVPRKTKTELPKRLLMKLIHGGFVAGQSSRDYLVKLGLSPSRITMGNDVVDNSLYASTPPITPLKDDQDELILGTAARLIPEKNLESAMNAFASFIRKHPTLRMKWKIAGRGPLEESLKAQAAKELLPIEFVGFQGYQEMPRFYQSIHIYWQPSLYEPWGLVINEAMASARPVLASKRCGCVYDLITDHTGWTHTVDSTSAIEKGLESMIQTRHQWPDMGIAARTQIQHWGPDRFAKGLYELSEIVLR